MIVFMAAEPEDLIGLSSVAGLPLVVSSSRVNGQWSGARLASRAESTKVAGGDQRQCQEGDPVQCGDGGPDHCSILVARVLLSSLNAPLWYDHFCQLW